MGILLLRFFAGGAIQKDSGETIPAASMAGGCGVCDESAGRWPAGDDCRQFPGRLAAWLVAQEQPVVEELILIAPVLT